MVLYWGLAKPSKINSKDLSHMRMSGCKDMKAILKCADGIRDPGKRRNPSSTSDSDVSSLMGIQLLADSLKLRLPSSLSWLFVA